MTVLPRYYIGWLQRIAPDASPLSLKDGLIPSFCFTAEYKRFVPRRRPQIHIQSDHAGETYPSILWNLSQLFFLPTHRENRMSPVAHTDD